MASGSIITASNITIAGNVNLNQGEIWCNSITVSGGVNGGGYIYYCNSYTVTGNINNNQNQPVIQHNCGVLSDNSINYELVEVPCEYLGSVVDGFYYMQAN